MEENQIVENSEMGLGETNKKKRLSTTALVAIILSTIGLALSMFSLGYHLGSKNVNSIAETTGVTEPVETMELVTDATETTESTTVPVETSVPETVETIPEETVIETEPVEEVVVTYPTKVDTPVEPTTEPAIDILPEDTTEPVTDETQVAVSQSDVELLACVIFQEAGADYACDMCRRRVADVVLNRVASPLYPDTIYEVLTQYCQYGRFYWTGVVWPASASHPANAHAVERAYRIAEEVLNGQHSDLYGDSYIGQAEFPVGHDYIYHCGIYFSRV